MATDYCLINKFELAASNINEFANHSEFLKLVRQAQWMSIALRLIHPSSFVPHRLIMRKDEGPWHPVQGVALSDKYYPPYGYDHSDGLFSGKDVRALRKYCRYVVDLAQSNEGKHHRVLTALDLFNEGLKQVRCDTKLILHVSAIEALFNFSKGETVEKVSLGGSRFIEKDISTRLNLYDEIKDLYNVRSAIIHGAKLGKVRGKVFYKDTKLQAEIAKLAYDVITKSMERIIHEDLAVTFNDPNLLKAEYKKALIGERSIVY